MGGGVGVSAHGSVRVVTDTTKMAMPEVGIGFIPDVGGTYILSRAPGLLGIHAALTGAPFAAGDAIAMGFADHFVPHDKLAEFTDAIVADGIDAALAAHATEPPPSELLAQRQWIDECYAGETVEDIVAALRGHDAGPANDAANLIMTRSPVSVSVALEAVRRAAKLDTLEDVLRQEYRTSCGSLRSHDLVEGIRAQVIDKDRNPKWSPPSLSAVTTADIEAYFAPAESRLDVSRGEAVTDKNYETILVDRDERVGTITLNRPKALNALNSQVMHEVTTAAAEFDSDPGIGAIVITGNEKAFAAGADIKEMSELSFGDVFGQDFFAPWAKLAAVRTPLIAAVAGYALGGGCELAMMCDVLIAADTAKFGQPEIKLGVLPGMGGSQRLTRAIGKAKAMDLILTGRTIDAEEADRSGLVSRVVPADELIREAKAVATTISQMSLSASRMAKEAVNRAFESSLSEGLLYERRLFHSAFATADQTEGMNAFSEKRPPNFTHS